MALRTKLLGSDGCTFRADITADYGDRLYAFSVSCEGNSQGDLSFTVAEPEPISGIAGTVTRGSGFLTFDDTALQFPLLADGQLAPVSAPWVFLRTLRSGCLTSAGADGELLRLSIDDSYREDALHLDIWLGEEDLPVRAEILYGERKILSMDVRDFQIR